MDGRGETPLPVAIVVKIFLPERVVRCVEIPAHCCRPCGVEEGPSLALVLDKGSGGVPGRVWRRQEAGHTRGLRGLTESSVCRHGGGRVSGIMKTRVKGSRAKRMGGWLRWARGLWNHA